MFWQLNLISKKGPNAKMRKNANNYQTLKNFSHSFRSLGILQNSYFWSSEPPSPSSIFIYLFVCFVLFCFFFFLSSHHDTNPLLHLYHFSKKNIIIYWLMLTVNHQGSYLPFFVFIQCVKHFCTPVNFVTI